MQLTGVSALATPAITPCPTWALRIGYAVEGQCHVESRCRMALFWIITVTTAHPLRALRCP